MQYPRNLCIWILYSVNYSTYRKVKNKYFLSYLQQVGTWVGWMEIKSVYEILGCYSSGH
jgi:hypothetical protein